MDCNCVHFMQPQATGSNPLIGSIICRYVRLVVRGPFAILYKYYFPVWGSRSAMNLFPHWGPLDPSGFQSILYLRPYIHLSVSMSVFPRRFLAIICADRNCANRMWSQAKGLNSLSESMIFLSVRPSGHPRAFVICVFLLTSSVGFQSCDAFTT